MSPPDSQAEQRRLAALADYAIMDTPPEPAFDRIVALAASLFDAPIAMVSLVDAERSWLKARFGSDLKEVPRTHTFCQHALGRQDPLVVPDAMQDARFAHNPLVAAAGGIRFYAGAPLRVPGGSVLGTLCILDSRPRPALTAQQQVQLEQLAAIVVSELELRRSARQRERAEQRLAARSRTLDLALSAAGIVAWNLDMSSGTWSFNGPVEQIWGAAPLSDHPPMEQLVAAIHPEDRERLLAGMRPLEGGERREGIDFRIQRPDGQMRWLHARGDWSLAATEKRALGVVFDVTEAREREAQSELIAREMHHRMRNLFATLRAIVSLTRRNATDLDDYRTRIDGRMAALERAQDALLDRGPGSGSLTRLMADLAVLHPRIRASGPECVLAERDMTSLSLVLSELATNAVKYGALSLPGGGIDLSWTCRGDRRRELAITWREHGGPSLADGAAEPGDGGGFGTVLMDRSIAALGGTLHREWRAGGLVATITLPQGCTTATG